MTLGPSLANALKLVEKRQYRIGDLAWGLPMWVVPNLGKNQFHLRAKILAQGRAMIGRENRVHLA